MSANSTNDDRNTDGRDALIRSLVVMASDPGERPVALATTDAVEVIKCQLCEDTGAHLLDSGSAFGRHHERNRENPPWERPEWEIHDEWATHNVFHYMSKKLDRDRTAVALEAALYATSEGTPRLGDMEAFADGLSAVRREDLIDAGLPDEFAEDVLSYARRVPDEPFLSFNTYNHECHSLSQVLQGVTFGGPYSDYVMIETHNGADVRGGYSGPRVYKMVYECPLPMEIEFHCPECDTFVYESCHSEVCEAVEFDPDANECRCAECGTELVL